jgi:hypothetical protein
MTGVGRSLRSGRISFELALRSDLQEISASAGVIYSSRHSV